MQLLLHYSLKHPTDDYSQIGPKIKDKLVLLFLWQMKIG